MKIHNMPPKGDSNMKTLVTGGTGFIGSHLIERLRERGDEVVCVAKDALNVANLEQLRVKVVLADLNNGIGWESLLSGVDYVYHLAGVTRCQSSKEYYEGNFLATKRFLDICCSLRVGLKRFVHVSSLAAVGPSLDGQALGEDAPYHPVSHYGKSKMLGEIQVLKARPKLPITVIRPSIVYGPRERDMYDYIRMVKGGVQLLIGFNEKLLSLIHSDDLVDGIIRAAETPRAEGEIYFLGSEAPYTTQELGCVIANVIHRHPIRVHCPHTLVYAVGAIADAVGKIGRKQVFFNVQKAKESVQSAWVCSVEKAMTQIGFRQRLSLEEGMRITYDWYCKNGWL
jgi:nucleoside-diphosphate-sugar epimerase